MVKRNFVDHTMYLRVAHHRADPEFAADEQYDVSATPLGRCFAPHADATTYNFIPNQIPLDTKNPSATKLAALSDLLISHKKFVPDDLFLSSS